MTELDSHLSARAVPHCHGMPMAGGVCVTCGRKADTYDRFTARESRLQEPHGRPGASDRVLIDYSADDTKLVCGCHFYREGTDATEPEHENDIMVWPCGRHLSMFGIEEGDDA